ncbi:uncharacterized protein isoform X2 [Choristoneura fumiferana]
MQWLIGICVLTAAVDGGGGATGTADLSQFWTDDYKVFEQIYGKTSDRELYGSTLPPNLSFGIDLSVLKKQATEKKERYVDTGDADVLESQSNLYSFGDNFNQLLTKQSLDAFEKSRPTKPSFKFIPYNDFKPISQTSDPETYNYYKALELLEKKKKVEALKGLASYDHPSKYGTANPEDTEAYKSIQDILEAHESNKGNSKKQNSEHENLAKYVSYGVSKSSRKKPGSSSRYIHTNDLPKPRCVSGRCRKRTSSSVRVRSGPIVRKIKHTIISD